MSITSFKRLYGASHTVRDSLTTHLRHAACRVEEVLLLVLEFFLELVLAIQFDLQFTDHLLILFLGIIVFLLTIFIVRVFLQLRLAFL